METCVRFCYRNKVFLAPEINIKPKRIRIIVINSYFFSLEELKAFSVCYFLREGVSCVCFWSSGDPLTFSVLAAFSFMTSILWIDRAAVATICHPLAELFVIFLGWISVLFPGIRLKEPPNADCRACLRGRQKMSDLKGHKAGFSVSQIMLTRFEILFLEM